MRHQSVFPSAKKAIAQWVSLDSHQQRPFHFRPASTNLLNAQSFLCSWTPTPRGFPRPPFFLLISSVRPQHRCPPWKTERRSQWICDRVIGNSEIVYLYLLDRIQKCFIVQNDYVLVTWIQHDVPYDMCVLIFDQFSATCANKFPFLEMVFEYFGIGESNHEFWRILMDGHSDRC